MWRSIFMVSGSRDVVKKLSREDKMATVNETGLAANHDPVVALYMRDVDRSLLRRNLSLTPQQRLEQLQSLLRFAEELRRAGRGVRHGASV